MSKLYEIVNRANQIASGRGSDASDSPVLDNEMTMEALFNHALRFVAADILRKGERVADLTRKHTIAMTAGVGALPDTVLRQAMRFASMPERDYASYLAPADYRRKRFTALLDYFTIEEDEVFYKQATVASFTGNAVFSFITLPPKNFAVNGFTAEIDLNESVVDDVVLVMAGALTGEIKLQTLLENQIK